jgi:hypothetical protein
MSGSKAFSLLSAAQVSSPSLRSESTLNNQSNPSLRGVSSSNNVKFNPTDNDLPKLEHGPPIDNMPNYAIKMNDITNNPKNMQ